MPHQAVWGLSDVLFFGLCTAWSRLPDSLIVLTTTTLLRSNPVAQLLLRGLGNTAKFIADCYTATATMAFDGG